MCKETFEQNEMVETLNIFSEHRSDRILYFILSTCILIVTILVIGVFVFVYPENSVILELTKSFGISLCLIIAQFAALLWLWTLTKAQWLKRYYEILRRKAVLTMIAVPLFALVYVWIVM